MKYYVWVEGKEEGPLDEDTLQKWVALGKIHPDTKIRNSLMKSWKDAGEIDFLQKHLEKLEDVEDAKHGIMGKLFSPKEKKAAKKETSTAFKYEYLPNPASAKLRIAATIFDLVPICILIIILFFVGVSMVYVQASAKTIVPESAEDELAETVDEAKKQDNPEKKEEEATAEKATEEGSEESPDGETVVEEAPAKDNLEATTAPTSHDDIRQDYKFGSKWIDTSTGVEYTCMSGTEKEAVWSENSYVNKVFYQLFTIFFTILLLYYGLALGLFAQTFGMWYWGIFIVKKEETKEVFLLRAYVYSLLMIFIGILSPIVVAVHPGKRSIHEMLTGTWIIRISAKPKA